MATSKHSNLDFAALNARIDMLYHAMRENNQRSIYEYDGQLSVQLDAELYHLLPQREQMFAQELMNGASFTLSKDDALVLARNTLDNRDLQIAKREEAELAKDRRCGWCGSTSCDDATKGNKYCPDC